MLEPQFAEVLPYAPPVYPLFFGSVWVYFVVCIVFSLISPVSVVTPTSDTTETIDVLVACQVVSFLPLYDTTKKKDTNHSVSVLAYLDSQ